MEEVGSEVENVEIGDFVVGSFVISDNTCEICQAGFQSECVHAEFVSQTIGTQAEKARIPHADGTLVATLGQPDLELIPSGDPGEAAGTAAEAFAHLPAGYRIGLVRSRAAALHRRLSGGSRDQLGQAVATAPNSGD